MHQRKSHIEIERARVLRRQDNGGGDGGRGRGGGGGGNNAPCPQGNGTTIGTVQQFTVLCNSNLDGAVLERMDAFDLTTCADLCSSFHPRCDGISYDGSRCTLRQNINFDGTRPARRFDAAVASFPGATSNCPTLSGTQQIQNTNYSVMCGFIFAGSDLGQNFAPTFQDCMGQCSATTGCQAISFDASQNQGFKNCYLKSAVTDQSNIAPDQGIDSAMLATQPTTAAAATPAPAAPTTADPGVATIPLPQPATTSPGGGIVFFTPPGGGSPVAAPAPAVTSPSSIGATDAATSSAPAAATSSSSDTLLLPGLSPSPSTGGLPPFFFPTSIGGGGGVATVTPEASSPNAWIAAPVVGSVAAIALIVISFIMLKRRRAGAARNGSVSSSSDRSDRPTVSKPTPIVSSLFTTWLPGSPGRRGSNNSSTRNKMGNFSEVTGKQSPSGSRNSMRNSVAGFLQPGGGKGMERLDDIEEDAASKRESNSATPHYELRNGKAELRNSLNGLGQNRWS
ncbi:hypothetical protein B0H63DRAFT_390740 [Podospora didyma]|uniref:Apple domain-containing protein n=1 Tax=Podospora didyma TaxID=330526 RepID=A0AAE0NX89_9PEZI|nr:hypothetical protein B0H63DRAFT_390740 [Podospora didyma]